MNLRNELTYLQECRKRHKLQESVLGSVVGAGAVGLVGAAGVLALGFGGATGLTLAQYFVSKANRMTWLRTGKAEAVAAALQSFEPAIQSQVVSGVRVSWFNVPHKEGELLRALEQYRDENPKEFAKGVALWKREGSKGVRIYTGHAGDIDY